MSLRANNNNNSAHFLSCLHPALGSIFPSAFAKPAQTRCSHIYTQTKKNTHTDVMSKMAVEGCNASKADGGQINKAFWIF